MDNPEHESKLDSLRGKAEHALDKFMDDPEKVEKAREKAEGFLGKHMDPAQAHKLVNQGESALEKFSDRHDTSPGSGYGGPHHVPEREFNSRFEEREEREERERQLELEQREEWERNRREERFEGQVERRQADDVYDNDQSSVSDEDW